MIPLLLRVLPDSFLSSLIPPSLVPHLISLFVSDHHFPHSLLTSSHFAFPHTLLIHSLPPSPCSFSCLIQTCPEHYHWIPAFRTYSPSLLSNHVIPLFCPWFLLPTWMDPSPSLVSFIWFDFISFIDSSCFSLQTHPSLIPHWFLYSYLINTSLIPEQICTIVPSFTHPIVDPILYHLWPPLLVLFYISDPVNLCPFLAWFFLYLFHRKRSSPPMCPLLPNPLFLFWTPSFPIVHFPLPLFPSTLPPFPTTVCCIPFHSLFSFYIFPSFCSWLRPVIPQHLISGSQIPPYFFLDPSSQRSLPTDSFCLPWSHVRGCLHASPNPSTNSS